MTARDDDTVTALAAFFDAVWREAGSKYEIDPDDVISLARELGLVTPTVEAADDADVIGVPYIPHDKHVVAPDVQALIPDHEETPER